MIDLSTGVLCVFGRGIEKVDEVWKPTQYIEQLSQQNGHPGVRIEGIGPNDDDSQVVVAGAELNVSAAAKLYEELRISGLPPKIVTFAAGRPAYLTEDSDPTLSEGRILSLEFLEKVKLDRNTEIVIQDRNKNTYDDIIKTLHLARDNGGLSCITIISVLVHVARCYELLERALETEPEFAPPDYEVRFLPAELVSMLLEPDLTSSLAELLISKAYCRTTERERKGLDDLRSGRYDFGMQGYGFAKTE